MQAAPMGDITVMELGEDSDHYIVQAIHLRSRLAAVKEPVTDRHFADIIIQRLDYLQRNASIPP